jgi:probable rRNA maturation factor
MTLRVGVAFEDGVRATVRERLPGGATGVERNVRRAVRATLEAEAVERAELSVTLMGDEGIAALNAHYLGHSGPTDVLSFALFAAGETPVGDVYIGFDEALRQAGALGGEAQEELLRLAVHGTLHVLGHDHPEGAGRTRCRMWRLQERIVSEVLGR